MYLLGEGQAEFCATGALGLLKDKHRGFACSPVPQVVSVIINHWTGKTEEITLHFVDAFSCSLP